MLISKSPVDTVELEMTSLPWNQKNCVCWEDDFLLTNFTVFFANFLFLVSAYFLFPFQPLHFGGGDVVQIGTSCFFFEVTWYILNSFHRLYHDRSCTPPTTPHRQFKNQRHLPRTKLGSPNDLFPMSKQCHFRTSETIGIDQILLLRSRDILRFLFLTPTDGCHDSEKKSGANGGGQLAEIYKKHQKPMLMYVLT